MSYLQDVYFSNLNAVNNLGGFFSAPVGFNWSCERHSFAQNKFYFITKGSCVITIENKQYTAKAGDWFFIPSYAEHSYYNHSDKVFEKYWVHFDLYPNSELFGILHLPYFVKVERGSNAYKLFKQYEHLTHSDRLDDKINIKSILLQLVAEYIRLSLRDDVVVKSISDTKIDDVLRFINGNIDRPLSVLDLSKEFHLHPSHMIRFFKNKTGDTPAHYIKARKMEIAKRYLESSELNVGEIMEKIGEYDMSSFSKQFKSRYSLSPRAYRQYYKKTRQVKKP